MVAFLIPACLGIRSVHRFSAGGFAICDSEDQNTSLTYSTFAWLVAMLQLPSGIKTVALHAVCFLQVFMLSSNFIRRYIA